ncbi:MAG TPA: cytochrome b [Alphaproteobacteria bacterium]|nr:cytochrome b [Alphaproteobacteria bacterium]
MQALSSYKRYDTVAIILHWLIALAILAMLAIGWTMTSLPKGADLKFTLFQWHKSIGITILILSVLRLLWRLVNPPPPLPATMKTWEKFAAHASHALLYILIIGMPLLGWAIVSASTMNLPTMLYGVIPWPNLPILPALPVADKKSLGHAFAAAHSAGAWILAVLLVIHIAAALKHHWWDRDDVLLRMMPAVWAGWLIRLQGGR